MTSNGGVWHKTTLQMAKERQHTYHTNALAGQKRAHDDVAQKSGHASGSKLGQGSQFRSASLLPKHPPRLTASSIKPMAEHGGHEATEYSQRRAMGATPSCTADPLLTLHHPIYKLPKQLADNFSSLGIKSIYSWQKRCLLGPGFLEGEKNLVYTAPTGGGKSLVADVLMLKRVIEQADAKALLVLPYVALVQEKVRWLRNVVQGISRCHTSADGQCRENRLWQERADQDAVRVVGFFGGSKLKPTWHDFDVGVCTIEKANALVNTAIDDCSICKLKVVVLDELHMVDDGHRGYLLELLATKLLCLGQAIQIIGMSATLTNIDLLAKWLEGHSYETRYRPVPIEEHLVYDGDVYQAGTTSRLLKATTTRLDGDGVHDGRGPPQPLRSIQASQHRELQDPVINAVVSLAFETANSDFGVLVFSSSRAVCESDALLISRVMPSPAELDPAVLDRRMDLLGDLRSLSTGLDQTLEQTIPAGVASHHAGLTTEERELVTDGYDSGILKVCVATCSLAAGINLPARRVILHNARMGRDLVGPSMLRQMRGRAGRKGKDEIGETYLCCRQADLEDVVELMHADIPQISSCLITDKRRIQRALLEIIAVRLATSRESLDDYVKKTLLFHSSGSDSIASNVESCLSDLQSIGFITTDQFDNFEATRLGKALVSSALDPEDGIFIHKELGRAMKAFVMDGEMHVLYTFTPVQDFSVDVNWTVFWAEMEKLDESGLRVLEFLGLKPTVIVKMLHGGTFKTSTPEEKEQVRIYRRFYLALQLRDLCNEVPIQRVAQKTCQGFAAGMIKFCEQMGWGAIAAVLDHFSDRLKAGARFDLLALAKIPFVKSRTARVFWDNSFKSMAAIANADPTELVPVLLQAQPNKVRLEARDEQKYKEKLLAKARAITEAANRLWQIEMQSELDDE